MCCPALLHDGRHADLLWGISKGDGSNPLNGFSGGPCSCSDLLRLRSSLDLAWELQQIQNRQNDTEFHLSH